MASTKFPGPYINSTEVDRTIMEYVPFNTTDIGARPSGLPKEGVKAGDMALDHVQNRETGGTVKHKQP